MEIFNVFIRAVAVFASGYVMSGVHVVGFVSATVAAIFFGVINTFVKPVIIFLTLPLNILSLGLFTFVINGFLALLVAKLVPGFTIDSFWWAVLFSIVMSIVNFYLHHHELA